MMAETASLLDSWESEVQAAWVYLVLAEVETGENRRLFQALSVDALEQSKAWVKAIEEAGGSPPGPYEAPFRVRLVGMLIRRIGPRSLLPALAALKVRGLSVYRAGPSSLEVLLARETGSPGRAESRDHLLGEEQRHLYTRGTVALHAAIFGVNDGLVSNTALILAASGAGAAPGTALLIGAAGMIAGAVSMAAGEYLGVRSRIELFERQIALEEEELRLYPDDEAEELAMIFEARGLERETARELGKRLISEPARALDVLTREELGLNPDDLGSPWASALASLLSFGGGALVPLLPLALLPAAGLGSGAALLGAVALSGVALFVSGAATSLFTGRSGVRSGLRLACVGLVLSGVLYSLGLAVRASLGG